MCPLSYQVPTAARWHGMRPLSYQVPAAARWHGMRPLSYQVPAAARWHGMRSLKGDPRRYDYRTLTGRHHRHCRQCNR
jgi:hypothetical protein